MQSAGSVRTTSLMLAHTPNADVKRPVLCEFQEAGVSAGMVSDFLVRALTTFIKHTVPGQPKYHLWMDNAGSHVR